MNVEDIIKKNKAKRNSYVTTPTSSNNESLTPKLKYFKNLISRILLAVIFVLFSIIYTNVNSKNKELYKKYVLEDSLSFTKINNLYQKYFGSVDVIKKKEESDSPVFLIVLNILT